MDCIAAFPLPPGSLAQPPQRHSDPTPTHTVSGELHQISAYMEAAHRRLDYLDEMLTPSAADEVGQIKRKAKDVHRRIEDYQRRADNHTTAMLMEHVKVESWQTYRALVEVEGRLKGQEPTGLVSYVPTGLRPADSAEEVRPSWFRGSSNSESSSGPGSSSSSISMPTALPANLLGEGDVDSSPDMGKYGEGIDWPAYMMSGALPAGLHVRPAENRTVDLLEGSSKYEEDLRESAWNLGLQGGADISPDAIHTLRRQGQSRIPPKLARTRAEVERSCREEESIGGPGLYFPDRRREGSTTSYFAAFSIMSGIDDPSYYLPKLLHIKIHEVKRLKEYLEGKSWLTRDGNISRVEKLLHLLFLLQDGVRFETIAVLFSRTPRQVQSSCNEVFDALMNMHGLTALPNRQPACDHLWRITYKYINTPVIAQNAVRYYGWWLPELINVLVTLNLYIGRYRQQGQVALSGECFKWWEAFKGYV
ncbi:hypothetical protein K458DRAFT_436821 [Lentithecium fluviatile CBS 122367]|uniref:Uncharacterized protein n=1 Tax=Lentithecium fluviatile CBS 122367 TaxID=1168545 RepID=A0A6G1IFV4_9PLEO|nr:hypothetical protein K458DRAFT_436821 [Lentithecium fluviatile CBS 122367]